MGRQKDSIPSRAITTSRGRSRSTTAPGDPELTRHLAPEERDSGLQSSPSWGCGTTMHVARLLAPTLDSEDYFKGTTSSPRASGRAGRRA